MLKTIRNILTSLVLMSACAFGMESSREDNRHSIASYIAQQRALLNHLRSHSYDGLYPISGSSSMAPQQTMSSFQSSMNDAVADLNHALRIQDMQNQMGLNSKPPLPLDWMNYINNTPAQPQQAYDGSSSSSVPLADSFTIQSNHSSSASCMSNQSAAYRVQYRENAMAVDQEKLRGFSCKLYHLNDAPNRMEADINQVNEHVKKSRLQSYGEMCKDSQEFRSQLAELNKELKIAVKNAHDYINAKQTGYTLTLGQEIELAYSKTCSDLLNAVDQIKTRIATIQECLIHNDQLIQHYKSEIIKQIVLHAQKKKSISASDFKKKEVMKCKNDLAVAKRGQNDLRDQLGSDNYNLEEIDKKLASWFSTNILGVFDTDHNRDWLNRERKRIAPHAEALERLFKEQKNNVSLQQAKLQYDETIASTVCPEGLSRQELSSDARVFVAENSLHLPNFEKLTLDEQSKVIDFLNCSADDQKIVSNPLHRQVINATAKVADVACQAYYQGKKELGSSLINFGHSVLQCAAAFSKGVIQGIGDNIQHKLDNPMKALESLAIGVVVMAGLPVASAAIGATASAVAIGAGVGMILGDVTQKVKNLSLTQGCQKVGEMAGDFVAEGVVLSEALKAASVVTQIVVGETAALIDKVREMGGSIAQIAEYDKCKTALARTAEGFEVAVNAKTADIAQAVEAQAQRLEMNALDAAKNGVKSEVAGAGATVKPVEWTEHGHKHVPSKNVSWKEITKNTKNGAAKYLPEINIEKLERAAWENGIPTTNGKPWKVIDNKTIIGASEGIETQYMRIENSANTIHGHPITFEEYRKLIK